MTASLEILYVTAVPVVSARTVTMTTMVKALAEACVNQVRIFYCSDPAPITSS